MGKENSDENNREWSPADPHGLTDWINDDSLYWEADAKDVLAQFRRLVRYLKRWRDVQFSETVAAKIFSIGLTVMVKESLVSSFSTEGARQDLQALRKTVEAILAAGYFTEEQAGRFRVRGSSQGAVARHLPQFEPGYRNTALQQAHASQGKAR